MPLAYPVADQLAARLDFQPIDHLLAAAREGYRLYELFRLAGPEELIHYVDAVVESDTPERHAWWPPACHAEADTSTLRASVLEPHWFEPPPELLLHEARALAAGRWPDIEAARRECRGSLDELDQAELSLIDAGQHPNDMLLRTAEEPAQVQRHFRHWPERRFHPELYRLLETMLRHPDCTGYAQRGRGDLYLLKLACREQRRRGGTASVLDDNPFPVRILGRAGGPGYDPDDDRLLSLDPYPAWTRNVRWQFEGLEARGLFFDEGGYGGMSYGEMEQCEPERDIFAIVATYADPLASTARGWSDCQGGVVVGRLLGKQPI